MPLSGLWVGVSCLYQRRMNEGWMLYTLGIRTDVWAYWRIKLTCHLQSKEDLMRKVLRPSFFCLDAKETKDQDGTYYPHVPSESLI